MFGCQDDRRLPVTGVLQFKSNQTLDGNVVRLYAFRDACEEILEYS